MEILGFLDNPGTASTWSTTPPSSQASLVVAPLPPVDAFADWQPTEIGTRFLRGRVRWGLLIVMVLMIAAAATTAFWIYQQPALLTAQTLTVVHEEATALQPGLETLRELNNDLLNQDVATNATTSQLLAVASTARDLFAGSANLPSSESASRSQAADAASDTLDASRLLGDAYAYRGAIIPILAAPSFETDRDLIALDEAARRYGEWQLKFDTVRLALPTGTLSAVTNQLAVVSGDLDALQTRYLDALRERDIARAIATVDELNDRLGGTEALLWSGLSDVQTMVRLRINQASSNIESLLD